MSKNVIANTLKPMLSPWSVAIGSILFLLAACGDTVENVNQTGVELFSSKKDLPECTGKNEGDLAVVKGESSLRVCMDGEWTAMTSEGSGVDGDFSCKTVELKDGSGLKIVCNGDSIGVVLNGSATARRARMARTVPMVKTAKTARTPCSRRIRSRRIPNAWRSRLIP